MKDDLFKNMYSGQPVLAHNAASHILSLNPALVRRARQIGADLLPVAALDMITDTDEAQEFRDRAYPLEIAHRFFPKVDYQLLEVIALDKPVKAEDCGYGRTLLLTPRIIANRGIYTAYNFVHSVVSKDTEALATMKMIWNIL